MARRRPVFSFVCLGLLLTLSGAPAVAPAPLVPANGPLPGTVASVSPPGELPAVVRSNLWASDSGVAAPASPTRDGAPPVITSVVLDAYRLAASVAPDSCNLEVSLLAAIGQVESGNLAGYGLDAQHRATPAVLGPVLDGTGNVRAIRDTDAGALDGDTTWDRAVGPMQFLPSTWRLAGVDLDADGLRDPQDIEDAAGAAMVYLCGHGRDLATAAGLEAAILAYNHSTAYLRLVLAWKHAYDVYGVQLAALPSVDLAAVRLAGQVDPATPPTAADGSLTTPGPTASHPSGTPAPTTPTPSAPSSSAPSSGTPTPATTAASGADPTDPAEPAPATESPSPSDGSGQTASPPTCTEQPTTGPDEEATTGGSAATGETTAPSVTTDPAPDSSTTSADAPDAPTTPGSSGPTEDPTEPGGTPDEDTCGPASQ